MENVKNIQQTRNGNLLWRFPFLVLAVRTGLEPVTPCVTGMYSNQTELTHRKMVIDVG